MNEEIAKTEGLKYFLSIFEKLQEKFDKIPAIFNDFEKRLIQIKTEFDIQFTRLTKDYENLDCPAHEKKIEDAKTAIADIKEKVIPDAISKINAEIKTLTKNISDEARERAVMQVYVSVGTFIVSALFAAIVARYVRG